VGSTSHLHNTILQNDSCTCEYYLKHIIDLPEDLAISSTFNVAEIFEYFPQAESEFNSRTSSFQEGETDVAHEGP
jgi:hypothetical protein